jgi:predicted dehydrogenase
MATTVDGCERLVQVARESGRLLQVCHVLRYTAFFSAIHRLIVSGRLGRVVTVEQRENVSYWHMAHSYVRGNWRRADASSPMILAKCCHDLDILYWYLGPCAQLSSVGSLLHFRPENAPPGAPLRCTDGCPHESECPWFAPRLYLDLIPLLRMACHSTSAVERMGASLALGHPRLTRWARRLLPPVDRALDYRGWPLSALSEDTSLAARRRALESGPYGRCVYRCDNDAVDHQIVNMQFESGASAALVMHGHSHREGRTLRIDGTRATLRGEFYPYRQEIEIHDHLTGAVERIDLPRPSPTSTGHGGGDDGLMDAFCRAVREGDGSLTTARESLESHLMAFAAERARKRRCTVAMDAYRRWAQGIDREPEQDDPRWIVA